LPAQFKFIQLKGGNEWKDRKGRKGKKPVNKKKNMKLGKR
jgi:hypothetical protein